MLILDPYIGIEENFLTANFQNKWKQIGLIKIEHKKWESGFDFLCFLYSLWSSMLVLDPNIGIEENFLTSFSKQM